MFVKCPWTGFFLNCVLQEMGFVLQFLENAPHFWRFTANISSLKGLRSPTVKKKKNSVSDELIWSYNFLPPFVLVMTVYLSWKAV